MYIKKNYKTINNLILYAEACNKLNTYTFISFDTETTGLNVRREKVIGFSFCGEEGVAYYFPIYTWSGTELVRVNSEEDTINILNLIRSKELIMWNGSFDIRIVKNNFRIDLTNSLVADAMLMKHTCDEEPPFALKQVAIKIQKYLKLDVEKEANEEQIVLKKNVEKNGGSTTKTNFEMYKADLDVLSYYACADADLTLRIANYYKKVLEKEDLFNFFFEEEVMPLYKEVTIPLEDNGVKLDMDLLKISKIEIENDLKTLESKIIDQLFMIDEFTNWHKATINSSYKESNRGKFAQGLVEYLKLPLPKSEKTNKYSITKSKLEKLPNSTAKEFLLGKIDSLDPELSFEVKRLLFNRETPVPVNISSKKQMGEIVFDFMGISPLSVTSKGTKQFNDPMIEELAESGHLWAQDLRDYNKLIKIKGAYIDRFLDNNEDGYYYFSYKQHGTISGRYGSDAQQLPKPMDEGQASEIVLKYNNRIRKFFISDKGRVFIDADYESLEPHVFAHVSNDQKLRDIFINGHDFYSTIAIDTERLSGYSADKKAENYLGKLNKPKRDRTKTYSLGIPYGLGGYALAKLLGISVQEGDELVSNYLIAYKDLKKWMDSSKKKAQLDGYVVSEAGRKRHLPKVKEIYKIYKDKLLDFRYRNKIAVNLGRDVVKSLYMDYKNGVNNSRNFQIQSMAASIVNRAAISINRKFKEEGIDGYCCAQIHDQLIIDVPEDKAEYCKNMVQNLMENTTKISVDLKAPPELAYNWCEGH